MVSRNESILPVSAVAAKRPASALGSVVTQRLAAGGLPGDIAIKRAREPVGEEDGIRVLIDRLWPRGPTKDELTVDLWPKDAAPSTALRRWYDHDLSRWAPGRTTASRS